eukprot:3941976-Rhodomonas_salina.1
MRRQSSCARQPLSLAPQHPTAVLLSAALTQHFRTFIGVVRVLSSHPLGERPFSVALDRVVSSVPPGAGSKLTCQSCTSSWTTRCCPTRQPFNAQACSVRTGRFKLKRHCRIRLAMATAAHKLRQSHWHASQRSETEG